MVTLLAPDTTRARQPDATGFAERAGGRIAYEVYGDGDPALMFVPPWQIVHSRVWKAQIPDFARRHRVIAWDARGNGNSDRPRDPAAHSDHALAADLLAVLDATATGAAVLVSLSGAANPAIIVASDHPARVRGLVLIAPSVPLGQRNPDRNVPFEDRLETDDGWAMQNIHFWRRDFRRYLEFFFGEAFVEPHSTKPIDDAVGWGLETDAETLASTMHAEGLDANELIERCSRIRCPTIVIQGDRDLITNLTMGVELAHAIPGARLEILEDSGHIPNARDPVRVNLLIRDFVSSLADRPERDDQPAVPEPGHWRRALTRRRRALYISSPIGLGHAQRDAAIAEELRRLQPDLEIDWLAQHPVTAVLESRGERIHPASRELASESAHITAESAEHDLDAFDAIRRMDEILIANFMVFHDAVVEGSYDLVIGDEAWDVDHYLHENPELKTTAFAWMTDFVGWLPMPAGGDRQAFLTADYNAEMIEHVERFPRLRDRAIFVGDPDDIVPDDFGPGLPSIRAWTERHFDFSGYVTGFDPAPLIAGRHALRHELGYHPGDRVVIVTVGGSGVGEALLRRIVAAFPDAERRVNGLRMIAVAGPRIDPAVLGASPGVEVRAFVPELYKHLAACDLAVVQGGLTTTMELTAARRPFLYFPLRDHFEQNRHVRHRLERYGAGRCMDYATADPEVIAEAIAQEIDRPIDYRPVAADGAARAAALIAQVL